MEVGLGPGRLCVRWGSRSPPKKGACPPKFSAHVYCGQMAGWIKIILGTEVGLSPGDLVVLDGDPAPCRKRRHSPSPIFGRFLLWPNGWIHQDATWCGARPQPMGLCVRWGPSRRPQKGGGAPKFSAHVYCGQTAGWIKMALGMEVGLSPCDFVLYGDTALTPQKGGRASLHNFRQTSTVPKRLDASRCHLVWR